MDRSIYVTPLTGRYSSAEMQALFSDDTKFGLWRKLWIALAKGEKLLGLPITDVQIAEMQANLTGIDYARAAAHEKRLKHDVMAHVKTYGEACPLAAQIIHLGGTSCYVTDNADLIILRDGLDLIIAALARVIYRVSNYMRQWRDMPTLAWTHFQAAQPTTVGKRAAMWLQDLVTDFEQLQTAKSMIRFLGAKGATGTQDSFVKLFEGDMDKAEQLDKFVADEFQFKQRFLVTGQTYSRKLDAIVLSALAGLATTMHKIGTDLRLLQHEKEVEEPFGAEQIGSSAMAYKRNPMLGERGCSLARHLLALLQEALMTHATQWLERTLDDSAGRRIYIPEAFLTADAILRILQNLFEGTVVHPEVIKRHLATELPFMTTEEVMMAMVKRHGADRQVCHERIRVHSQAAAGRVKGVDGVNDLIERLKSDSYFAPIHASLDGLLADASRLTGRAALQVDEFFIAEVAPILLRYDAMLDGTVELNV